MVKRMVLTAILVAALLIGGYSYMNGNAAKYRRYGVYAGAFAYMEEKYGEPFEYVKPWGSHSPTQRQVIVSCDSLPGKEILVVIDIVKKKESYRDNFMDVYFRPQTTEFFSEIASKYFDDFTLVVGVVRSSSGEGVSFDTSFEEYIKNGNRPVTVKMNIEDSDEDTVLEFLDEVKTLDVRFDIAIDILSIGEGYTAYYFKDYDEIYLIRRKLH